MKTPHSEFRIPHWLLLVGWFFGLLIIAAAAYLALLF